MILVEDIIWLSFVLHLQIQKFNKEVYHLFGFIYRVRMIIGSPALIMGSGMVLYQQCLSRALITPGLGKRCSQLTCRTGMCSKFICFMSLSSHDVKRKRKQKFIAYTF